MGINAGPLCWRSSGIGIGCGGRTRKLDPVMRPRRSVGARGWLWSDIALRLQHGRQDPWDRRRRVQRGTWVASAG